MSGTSGGVIVGVGAVGLTGWQWARSPWLPIAVAANHHAHRHIAACTASILGLMDTALPAEEQAAIRSILDPLTARTEWGISRTSRTRRAASRRFVSVHILVPGAWTVQKGHDLLERVEKEISQQWANIAVLTHLEPVEDSASWDDTTPDCK